MDPAINTNLHHLAFSDETFALLLEQQDSPSAYPPGVPVGAVLYDTMQEAFDATCRHLAKQKRRAFRKGDSDNAGGCFYHNPDNSSSCAVGCHLPWSQELVLLQGGVDFLVGRYPGLLTYLNLKEDAWWDFWNYLQKIHDTAGMHLCKPEGPEVILLDLKDKLLAFSEGYHLNPTAINEIKEWSL